MFQNARRYIAIQAMVEFIGNAVLNAAIGWYWTDGFDRIKLWGWWASAAMDLVPTGFGIGFVLTLIFTWRCHRRLRAGTTSTAALYPGRIPRVVYGLPFNPWLRSLSVGAAGALLGLLIAVVWQAFVADSMARQDFIVLKTIFAAIMAAGAMTMAGYRALGDGVSPERPKGYWPG